jgi:energy-coupling factor transporter ATP-binding protein EcfA2
VSKIINPEEDKKFNPISALQYIETRRFKVEKFLDERIRKVDKEFVLREILKNPVSLANIIKYNYEMSEEQRIRHVISKIIEEGNLTIMIGAKGFGKTATATWLIEKIHEWFKKNIYWFGYNEGIEKAYPYVKQTCSLTGLEENSFLIFDEGSLAFFSREFMKREQRERIKELPTLRHRGLSLIIISQFSTSLDIDLFMLSDYIWFKPYFVSELDARLNLPKWLIYALPHNKDENLVYDMNLETVYLFKNPLPSNWNEKISKPFSIIKSKKEANTLVSKLRKLGFSEGEILDILRIRGWEVEI